MNIVTIGYREEHVRITFKYWPEKDCLTLKLLIVCDNVNDCPFRREIAFRKRLIEHNAFSGIRSIQLHVSTVREFKRKTDCFRKINQT